MQARGPLPRRSGGLEMQLGDFGSALSDVVVHFGYGGGLCRGADTGAGGEAGRIEEAS